MALLATPHPSAAQSTSSKHKTIIVRWADEVDEKTLTDSISRLKITSDDTVTLRVTHFNWLHYSLKFGIEERTIESYVMLERLWAQILPKPLGQENAALSATAFEKAIVAWRRRMATVDSALSEYTMKFASKVALSGPERQDIVAQVKSLGSDPIVAIETLRRAADALAESIEELDIYERILARHQALLAKLQAFVKAADLVDRGEIHVVGKRKAGTVVTFTITPVNEKGAQAGTPFQSAYFVRSVYPLVLHVGYAASRLKDVEFDKVRSESGSDLFLATKSSDKTESLVTFMSYELRQFGPSADVGLHLTLGTNFDKPGEQLFVGAGLRFTKFVLSVGFSGGEVQEGSNPIGEAIAGAAGRRELFTTIASRKKWEPFAAVSLRVF